MVGLGDTSSVPRSRDVALPLRTWGSSGGCLSRVEVPGVRKKGAMADGQTVRYICCSS